MATPYSVQIVPKARKQLEKLERPARERIARAIDGLAGNPRPPGCLKLTGEPGFRVRVGDCRVLYLVDDGAHLVTVQRIGNRREVYR